MKDKVEKIFDQPYAIVPRGYWTAVVYDKDRSFVAKVAGTNVVTTNGKDFLASFLVSAAAAASTFTMNMVACGTGTTPETAADTALVVEIKRVTASVSHNGSGIYQLIASFGTNSAVGAIAEYGIFNSTSAGTMLARDTESVVNVGSTDNLTVTAQITFS